tara:strand:- start:39 stop:215 length:177 start_codon:yes stop_codon:yes gene_type:complete
MSSVIAKLSQELSNSMTLEAVKAEIEIFRNHGPDCAESPQLQGMWMLYRILEQKYGGD